jgi:hypothetical protein
MTKRILFCVLAILFAAAFQVTADKGGKDNSWVGWVTDTHCAPPKGDPAKHSAGCVNKCVTEHSAQYALYTPADKKVYVLDNAEMAKPHAGHHVKVSGELEGDKIKVKAIEATGEQKGVGK